MPLVRGQNQNPLAGRFFVPKKVDNMVDIEQRNRVDRLETFGGNQVWRKTVSRKKGDQVSGIDAACTHVFGREFA